MDKQIDRLFNKYMDQVKPLMVPFLIMYIIHKRGKASSLELKKDLEEIAGRPIKYEYTSFYRLIGKLRYEYKIIVEVDLIKEKGPPRVYYSLTPLGEALMKRIYNQLFVPMHKVSLEEKGENRA